MARTARIPAELKLRPFSLSEASAAGISKSALKGRSWRRLGSGLFAFAGLRDDAMQLLHAWHGRLPDAIFTGLTTAWLHHLDVDPCHPVEVALPPLSGVRSKPGLSVRHQHIARCDITVAQGLPATTLSRTMADLTKRLSRVEFLVLADQALRLALGRFDPMAERAESPMETRLRWMLVDGGLPRPEVQVKLPFGRADLYHPQARLVIEYDGGNHRDRLIEGNRRQNVLVNAGYKILRFTAADLRHRADAVVAEVRAALEYGPIRRA